MRRFTLVLLATVTLVSASAAGEPDDAATLFEVLGTREQILENQTASAVANARAQTQAAYRMARQRELGFLAHPNHRLAEAQSFDLALVALRRSLGESQTLAGELERVRAERARLEAALVDRALGGDPSTSTAEARPQKRLLRPVRGTPVAMPGLRRDVPTKVELHHDSIEILTRLNDPVRAIAPGVVKRVEALPQGGFAVVVEHDDGTTSIVSGLRDFAVEPGTRVDVGGLLGVAGRNLDGAAVISFEVWQHRRPLDPAHVRGR